MHEELLALRSHEKQKELAERYLKIVADYDRLTESANRISLSIDEMRTTSSPASIIDDAIRQRDELRKEADEKMRQYESIFADLTPETRDAYLREGSQKRA